MARTRTQQAYWRNAMTDEQRAERNAMIAAEHARGLTAAEIAERHVLSRGAVEHILRRVAKTQEAACSPC